MRKIFDKFKSAFNRKGFSLVEILIAIAVLAIITVPLAMNMISGSRLNSQAKQVAASSDLTTSLMEVMQTVDLSDILIDVNGYNTDLYGTKIPYLLRDGALKKYNITDTMEVIKQEDGTYVPVIKREDVNHDYEATSSIMIRNVGTEDKVVKAYFVGQASNNYAFVLKGIESDDMLVDVLATITPEKSYDIVNIINMQQSEMVLFKQPTHLNQTVADEFNKRNDTIRLTDSSVIDRSPEWYLNNMSRTVTLDLVKDARTDAVTITATALYTMEDVDDNGLRNGQMTYSKKLGSFSTNSTAEFARGVYLAYNPLVYVGERNNDRDHFVINNKNELGVPIFLIAQSEDAAVDVTSLTNYKPTLEVNELSAQIYQKVARTTVCSNIDDNQWQKTLYPVGRDLNVKTLGNNSEQQTLYSLTIQVFRHRNESFNDDGVFMPRDKDLLVETNGTFLDTSEKLDINDDVSTGLTTPPGEANAWRVEVVYDGTSQTGVQGNNVDWSGTTYAIEAGTYTATATPKQGYAWANGETTPKKITWVIKRAPTAEASSGNKEYDGTVQVGVTGNYVEWTGTYQAKDAGKYTAYATPDRNHCWPDGSTDSKKVTWTIFTRTVTITWVTGPGGDTWQYDGLIHTGSFSIGNLIPGDSCSASVSNITIRDVGSKVAKINSLSNKNYSLPTDGSDKHTLTITNPTAAYFTLAGYNYTGGSRALTYNGNLQSIIAEARGVIISGNYTAKNYSPGGYTFTVRPQPGYTWDDGTTTTRTQKWYIEPKTVSVQWGQRSWTYDGLEHSTTCTAVGVLPGDSCSVIVSNNYIRDAGSKEIRASGLSNTNYKLGATPVTTLTVYPAPLARVETQNFQYDGYRHTGVYGSYIDFGTGSINTHTEVRTDSGGNTISYVCYVKPSANYTWASGKEPSGGPNADGYWTVTWKIDPIRDAEIQCFILAHSGTMMRGAYGTNCEIVSYRSAHGYPISMVDRNSLYAKDVDTYYFAVRPIKNHAWRSVSYTTEEDPYIGTAATRSCSFMIRPGTTMKPTLAFNKFTYTGEVIRPQLNIIVAGSNKFELSGQLTGVDVGTYTIRVKLKDGETWDDGSKGDIYLSWKIEPKPVTITIPNQSWTYDGKEKTATAVVSGLADGDSCGLIYSGNKQTHAGTYTFRITGVTNPNYQLPDSNLTGTFTIDKRPLSITWPTPTSVPYKHASYTWTVTFGNIVSGDNPKPVMSNNVQTNVGSYTVRVTGISNDPNGDYRLGGTTSKAYTITRENNASFRITSQPTYNGSEQFVGYSAHGIIVTGTSVLSCKNANEFGTPHSITVQPDSNHSWPDGSTGAKSYTWVMYCQPVNAIAVTGLSYTGNPQTGVRETVSGAFNMLSYRATNAGSYTASCTPTANYKWASGTAWAGTRQTGTVSWSIAKAQGYVSKHPTVVQTNVPANGSLKTLFSLDGVSGTGAFSYSGSLSAAAAGTHTLSYWVEASTNYTRSQTYTITATLTANADASAEGHWWYWTGSAKEPYTLTNAHIVRGDTSVTSPDEGNMTAYVVPNDGHAWADTGTFEERAIYFGIVRHPRATFTYSKNPAGTWNPTGTPKWYVSCGATGTYVKIGGTISVSSATLGAGVSSGYVHATPTEWNAWGDADWNSYEKRGGYWYAADIYEMW